MIQRLVATGLSLQGAARLAQRPELRARIAQAVEGLDLTVKHIRSAIFGRESSRPSTDGLRSRILSVAGEAAGPLGFEARVLFEGPLDTAVPASIVDDLETVLREALTNVARHAKARRVDVSPAVELGGDIVLRIEDDGVGPPDDERLPGSGSGLGLRNLARRAERHGDGLAPAPGASGGSVLEWRVPQDPSVRHGGGHRA